jgi:hypothetical protein
MNALQEAALRSLVERYNGTFDEKDFSPASSLDGLPSGYVAGWVKNGEGKHSIFVGCSPKGEISS